MQSQAIPPISDLIAVEATMQILHIIPSNQTAKRLFTKCYEHVKSSGDDYHANFMVKLPIAESVLDAEPVESETDYESISGTDLEEQLFEGYYNICVSEESTPQMLRVGWKVGKGHSSSDNKHRMVDILLAKPGDVRSKTLSSVVCRLYLDQLGILVAHRPKNSKGDIEIKLDDSWEVFAAGEGRPLYKKSSWLRAGHCDYEFRYAIEPSQRKEFLSKRDLILSRGPGSANQHVKSRAGVQITLPHLPPLNYVAGDPVWSNGKYVRLGTIASGTFGYIREGFSINPCRRIAIKELRLGREHDCDILLNELNIMRELQGSRGIISCDDYHCEHGEPQPCRLPENFSICFPQAIHDFSKLNWFGEHTLETRLQLLQQPLLGLCGMHEKGIMHRDVTIGNMLILSYHPPQAVVSDFGKAIHAQKSRETTIGPIPTLAPEVWSTATDGPYGNSIDVWAYGYAVARILRCADTHRHMGNNRITKKEQADIQKQLDHHAEKFDAEADLIDLIKSMLTWDGRQRITTQVALAHKCWNKINIQPSKRRAEDAEFELPQKQGKVLAPAEQIVGSNIHAIAETQPFGSQTQDLLARGSRYLN
ncbi:MAG: hypothetical protein GOMPHAMPRED_001431 [Gomphillus americanus]|uniref:EKC/KEOPS complex subunit BUD32 n=1 Tax=Gomphillus americanus TaxID=1940652 RepID=A0A8H3F454_9LECA|nr:MAG: hypothetical protein GOMPHAMPRED_001431 [Gomphillus americanus]